MILFPAIDLKDGQACACCAATWPRRPCSTTIPAAQAARLRRGRLRMAAPGRPQRRLRGPPVNAPAVEAILAAVDLPVQLGGGIRDMATVERWLGLGVRRVILGTVAVKDPALVREPAAPFPAASVRRHRRARRQGGDRGLGRGQRDHGAGAGARFEDAGVAAIVYTDIDRDGALQGVNVEATASWPRRSTPGHRLGRRRLAGRPRAPAIADEAGIEGVISGRALYDGRIDPKSALALLAGETGGVA
jgi:phosphoribosylformimino-5-aminoimidazole carboxamide ribotide isomerase